ncbi:MAG: hypothetical protein V4677_16130 [Bacteroidota bacterium]
MKRSLLLLSFLALLIITYSCSTGSGNEKKIIPINSVNDVLTNLQPLVQSFEIKFDEENLIKGKKGTAIYIPANAFQFADGSVPDENIVIELKECYSLSDMIAENLSTMSGDKILQTGGMINIKASSDGKELLVKDGKAIVIGFPKNNRKDTMDLFFDYQQPDGPNTWVPDYKIDELEKAKKDESENVSVTKQKAGAAVNPEGGDRTESDTISPEKRRALLEMEEDMYDYTLNCCFMSGNFLSMNLSGQNRTIVSYIDAYRDLNDSMLKQFSINDWRVHFGFNIDRQGKMFNFKPDDDNYTKYNEAAMKYAENILKNAPPFELSDLKDYFDHKKEFDYTQTYSLGMRGGREINKEKCKNKFREKYAQYKDKAIQKLDKTALDYYTFSATKLNWINCDKFWNTSEEKIEYVVKIKNAKEAKVQIIFNGINSIMNGTLKGDAFVFSNIPVNQNIKIVGISYSNGKPTMSSAIAKTDKKGYELNSFKEFSLDELETELNKSN